MWRGNRWFIKESFNTKFVHVFEQTHTYCVCCVSGCTFAWTCSLCWSGVMFARTWTLNQSYISWLMRCPDGRGQPRGALILNSPMSDSRETHRSTKGSSAEGGSTMMPLSVKLRWAANKVCVFVYMWVELVYVCETDWQYGKVKWIVQC